jgi:dTDP-6-deoxy-L-lyxo-4-hexulose reductase RmlD-like protein
MRNIDEKTVQSFGEEWSAYDQRCGTSSGRGRMASPGQRLRHLAGGHAGGGQAAAGRATRHSRPRTAARCVGRASAAARPDGGHQCRVPRPRDHRTRPLRAGAAPGRGGATVGRRQRGRHHRGRRGGDAREMAFATTCDGPAALAEACGDSGASLIHLSTDYVFDGENPAAYTEADPVNPLSVYGASKAQGESAVRQRLAQHVIFRTSWATVPSAGISSARCCAWARSGNGSRWSTTSRAARHRR